MFLAPSAGSSSWDWTEQLPFFPRCQRQYSAGLCILRHHLKTPFLLEEISIVPPFHEFAADNQSVSDGGSQVTENAQPSCQSWASHQDEGVTSVEPTVTASTSQHGQVRKMSRRMAESVAQGMHHMAHQSTLSETNEDLFHDAHLKLQERMRNPIAFHAEMMCGILYLKQVLRQPDAKEFVQAVIKEVNGHVDCKN
jgi:hypothetical protein